MNCGTFAPRNFRSLERKLRPWNPEPVVAIQECLTAFQSSVDTNNDGGGLAQPAQLPDTCLQAGPILAGSYPVQAGDFCYDPVCARVQRAFVPLSAPDVPQCAGPSAGVLESLQGQRTDDIAMLGRCAHLTGPAQH